MNKPSSIMNFNDCKKSRDESKFWGHCCDHEKLNQELLKINDTLMAQLEVKNR